METIHINDVICEIFQWYFSNEIKKKRNIKYNKIILPKLKLLCLYTELLYLEESFEFIECPNVKCINVFIELQNQNMVNWFVSFVKQINAKKIEHLVFNEYDISMLIQLLNDKYFKNCINIVFPLYVSTYARPIIYKRRN